MVVLRYNANMEPEQTELTRYLADILHQLKILENRTFKRNKTKRIKAIASTITIVMSRANATYQYVRAGGHSDFSIIIQQQMYDPIIQWLEGELA